MPNPTVSQITLPDGNTYNIVDKSSGYTDTVVTVEEENGINIMYITSSIINADEEEF